MTESESTARPDEWETVWALFDAAIALPPEERVAFAEQQAAPGWRLAKLLDLLAAHERAGAFLEDAPPGAVAADVEHERRLAERLVGRTIGRYRIVDLLGIGGTSTVYEAEQEHPRRTVALKLLRTGLVHPSSLRRFHREAHLLGQLQHPGIAQVFEAGTAEAGAGRVPFFAMELVRGSTLLQHADKRDLDLRARLGLLAAVCDAVEHAHAHGIVHRDLKPANILVDETGRVRVVDFGVALATDADLPAGTTVQTHVGQIVGTLPYMSPEQVTGARDAIDPRTDVYAIGVITYRLLAGRLPFEVRTDELLRAAEIITKQAPPRLGSERPELRGDLETVVGKALAKEPAERYATAAALGADLARVLAHEPILARRPSALYRLRKLVRRRPVRAAAVAVALLVATGLVIAGMAISRWQSTTAAQLDVFRDREQLTTLNQSGRQLWPHAPATVQGMERWLAEADALLAGLPALRAELAELRQRALPWSAEDAADDARTWAEHQVRIENVRAEYERIVIGCGLRHGRPDEALMGENSLWSRLAVTDERVSLEEAWLAEHEGSRLTWRFADAREQALHGDLAALVEGLRTFALPYATNEHRPSPFSMRRALAYARQLPLRTVDEQADVWAAAMAAIADRTTSPLYDGLSFAPIPGLLPLGPDPDSGLWEFAHVPSGFPAVRDPATGRLQVDESTGIVLVLLPGGEACRGAAPGPDEAESACGRVDPRASPDEWPGATVTLAPFFMSKFEVTQRQWNNFRHNSPSHYTMYNDFEPGLHLDGRQPVEDVTWRECADMALRMGLALPTEAQWEYAARGGTNTPWWCAEEALPSVENLADQDHVTWMRQPPAAGEPWSDGHQIHAPVGSFRANPFGLHDILGNVREWTRDVFAFYDAHPQDPDTGELLIASGDRIIRGGSFRTVAGQSRCALRKGHGVDHHADDLGLRPVLALPVSRAADERGGDR